VYELTLARKLEKRGLSVKRQVAVPIEYEGAKFDEGFRADLIVEGRVIIELKSVMKLSPAHPKQLSTYLRLTGLKVGYLLNFGEALMKTGITRIIAGSLEVELRASAVAYPIEDRTILARLSRKASAP